MSVLSSSEGEKITLLQHSPRSPTKTPKVAIFETMNKNKKQASWKDDILGISVLMLLYCLQGIPLGLIFGSLPFVMAERLSYSDQAIFSLAAYPYSLKLFWSPIVDVLYKHEWGRRKSWIFPMQTLMGLTMIYISYHFNEWSNIDNDNIDTTDIESPQVWTLTLWFFFLVFLTATQDIAVDGWALTILSESNREMQAMCQTVGQTFGYALAFPVFLALNSPEICIKWFGAQKELVTPESFLMLCGVVLLIVNVLIAIFISERSPTKKERIELDSLTLGGTYRDILHVIRIPSVYKLCAVLLTSRIAFSCVDSVTSLKLNEKGFPKETAGLLVFFYVPFEILFPFLIAYINSYLRNDKMTNWQIGFILRIIVSAFVVLLVFSFKLDENGNVFYSFLFKQIFIAICYSFTSSLMFTSQCGFFAKIADETIGGTYLTLLNTLANLGNTWPKYFVLRSIDIFTIQKEVPCLGPELLGEHIPCFDIEYDGYYYVAAICSIIGLIWIWYTKSTLDSFGSIPKAEWTVQRTKIDID